MGEPHRSALRRRQRRQRCGEPRLHVRQPHWLYTQHLQPLARPTLRLTDSVQEAHRVVHHPDLGPVRERIRQRFADRIGDTIHTHRTDQRTPQARLRITHEHLELLIDHDLDNLTNNKTIEEAGRATTRRHAVKRPSSEEQRPISAIAASRNAQNSVAAPTSANDANLSHRLQTVAHRPRVSPDTACWAHPVLRQRNSAANMQHATWAVPEWSPLVRRRVTERALSGREAALALRPPSDGLGSDGDDDAVEVGGGWGWFVAGDV